MATRTGPDDPRCADCPNEREPGRARCEDCRERHRKAAAARREALKRRKRCTVCGAPAAPHRQTKKKTLTTLCAQHQQYYAERSRSDRNRTT